MKHCAIKSRSAVQENEKKRSITGDFDKNGMQDSVTIFESFGSSTYSLDVRIKEGNQTYVYGQEFGSGSFLNPVFMDKLVFKKYKCLFMDSVLFRYPVGKVDASLQWLLDARCSKQFLTDKTFDLMIRYTPEWNTNLQWPNSYKIPTDRNYCEKKDSAVMYVYTADNHYINVTSPAGNKEKYTALPQQGYPKLTLLKMPHAVIVKNKNKYSWIFISDEEITESGEKLRLPSIESAICSGNLVFVVQKSPEKRVFMVNYKQGLCLRLSEELYNQEFISGIAVHDGRLFIKTTEGEHVIETAVLEKAAAKY
ncbi:MAG: hypothetical protein JWO09_1831 [Bacteroidetes bacterium]|nr:hypothetical protein [Bacteroidota bacterium]